MSDRSFEKHAARRLAKPGQHTQLAWMAKQPSTRCPMAKELLQPEAFQPPAPPLRSAEEQRLWDQILARPHDDETRLHYADWCEQHHDVMQAAFIREQLQTRCCSLASELQASPFAAVIALWQARLLPWSVEDLVFHRGLPYACSVAGRAFLSLGAALLQTAPFRDLRLVAIAPYWHELCHCQHLLQIDTLRLTGNSLGSEKIRQLADSPFVANLQHIDMTRNQLDDVACDAIIASTKFTKLQSITVEESPLITVECQQKLVQRFPVHSLGQGTYRPGKRPAGSA